MCDRCFAICSSFSKLTVDKVVDKKGENDETIALEYKLAGEIYDKLEARVFQLLGSVHERVQQGVKMSSSFWFITVREFQKMHKLDPKCVGIHIHTFLCEQAERELRGILAKPMPEDPQHLYRLLTVYSDKITILSKELLPLGRQLRVAQPSEVFSKKCKADAKERHEDLKRAARKIKVLTLEEIAEAVEAEHERVKARAAAITAGGEPSTDKGRRRTTNGACSVEVAGVDSFAGKKTAARNIDVEYILWGFSPKVQLAGVWSLVGRAGVCLLLPTPALHTLGQISRSDISLSMSDAGCDIAELRKATRNPALQF